MELITVGADPEAFIKEGNSIISCIGLLGGTKRKPRKYGNIFVQEDNVLAEFNIPPCTNKKDFIKYNQEGMEAVASLTGKSISIIASHKFTEEYIKSQPVSAHTFGCSPDNNAWTGKRNSAPKPTSGLRSAGGHIHVGAKISKEECAHLVKCMDVVLGLPSILMDSDTDRRSLYGGAGSYRRKPYGLEYRTLSNFWLRDAETMGWAYDSVEYIFKNYDHVLDLVRSHGSTIQTAINNSDKGFATTFIHQHKEVFDHGYVIQ